MPRRLLTLAGLVFAAVGALAVSASSAELPPGGTFLDDDGNTHEGAIEAIVSEGITFGCDDRGIFFCPEDVVTRGQMAAFLSRALDLAPTTEDFFVDDNGNIFEADINRIAAADITLGCNPPANTHYCANRGISRAEMATLLTRAFPELMPDTAPDAFTDDTNNTHQANINRLAAAGITAGCNPPTNTHFCPQQGVTRAQMASFLVRALGLETITPPERIIERVSRFTTHYDCCQNRVTNIRTMAKALDGYVVLPGETFSIDAVVGPRTTAKGYLPAPYLQNGEGECCAVGGGVSQFGTTIHNAVFWGGYDIVTFRPHSGWISRYPLGIEHTLVYSSIDFRFTNDTDTPVIIDTSSTSTSVTVELWGYQGGWQMSGDHPRGNRNSEITILDRGSWSEAKRVSATVTGSAPGLVRIVRTLTTNGVGTSETWWWNYVS